MSTSTPVDTTLIAYPRAPWWEIFIVLFASLGVTLLWPDLKLLAIALVLAYMLIERRLRHRTWSEIGFNGRSILTGVRQNWGWILLVGVGTQMVATLISYFFLPDYFRHVVARLPVSLSNFNFAILIALGISTLGEEILYRGLFQSRVSAFIPSGAAIALTSLVFALMHYAPGAALVVAVDLTSVLIDSAIFGIIFHRSHNLFVSWIAHFLADIVGLVFLLALA